MNTDHMLFLMLAGHALADYPLQGDWLAKAKNPNFRLTPRGLEKINSGAGKVVWYGVRDGTTIAEAPPQESIWFVALQSHAFIHALAVYIASGGNMWVTAAEFFAHMVIDYAKCDGRIGYNTDQLLHLLCKVLWVTLIWSFT